MERYLATIRISVQLRKCSNGNFSRSDRLEQETYDLLPHWAAQPKQTPERVLAAARELNKLTADLPPDLDAMKREYLRLRRAFSGGYATMIEAYRGGGEEVALLPLTWLWSQLPWERTRALRLLNVLTRQQLAELADIQAAAARGEAIRRPPVGWTSESVPFLADGIGGPSYKIIKNSAPALHLLFLPLTVSG